MHVSLNNEILLTPPLSSIFYVFCGALPSKTKPIHSVFSASHVKRKWRLLQYINFYIQWKNAHIAYERLLLLQLLRRGENGGQRATGWGWKYANRAQSVSSRGRSLENHNGLKIKTVLDFWASKKEWFFFYHGACALRHIYMQTPCKLILYPVPPLSTLFQFYLIKNTKVFHFYCI